MKWRGIGPEAQAFSDRADLTMAPVEIRNLVELLRRAVAYGVRVGEEDRPSACRRKGYADAIESGEVDP